ncbi:hypothetical protein TWF730_007035 [Orbilia blumenaviensis]|uniref:F-box domain-containing protein n=1 Tax=Orbilia blumenaviensis TaxID=1796055 RepID=A0AAV9VG24_9PEZI
MSILGGLALLPVPPEMMRMFRGARSFNSIYSDPMWPEALYQILQRVCPPQSWNQSTRNQEFTDLWRTCRSVCRTWKNIIENPQIGNQNNAVGNLMIATFKNNTPATLNSEVQYCIMAIKWVQKRINSEVNQQQLNPPSASRRFGLRCHTEFKLLWRNCNVTQMYASFPVVKNLRIRSMVRATELDQRKALLRVKGFNIPGASILREWDGWHLTAPGGVTLDMMVAFVALAVEIDVLMQNARDRELVGTPRPRFLDLLFTFISTSDAKILATHKFDIPMVEGQMLSGGNELGDLWNQLMNTVLGGDAGGEQGGPSGSGGQGALNG